MTYEGSENERLDDEQNRRRLIELREALFNLHKALIDSERISYERIFGSIPSSADFLQLLIRDPWFVWLQPFSQSLVLIDEMLDSEDPVTRETADTFVKNIRTLLTPSENGEGFPSHYFEALQRDPDVVMAHAEVVRTSKL